jgi:hypothetical protein
LRGIGDRDWPMIRPMVIETEEVTAVLELLRAKGFRADAAQPHSMRDTGARLVHAWREA